MESIRKGCLALAVMALLTGCASRSLFVSYPSQAAKWKAELATAPSQPAAGLPRHRVQYRPGNPLAAAPPASPVISKLEAASSGADGVLYLQELGEGPAAGAA